MGVTIRRIVAIQSVASGTVSMIQGMNNMLLLSEVEVNCAGPNCECSPTLATTIDPLFPLLIKILVELSKEFKRIEGTGRMK